MGGGVESLDDYITQYLPARYWAVFSSLVILLAILWIDAPTTLILLFAAPMLILLLALIGGQAQRLTQKRFAELSWMSAFYLDILQGLPTLKLFGRSREQADNIERISRQLWRHHAAGVGHGVSKLAGHGVGGHGGDGHGGVGGEPAAGGPQYRVPGGAGRAAVDP